MESPVRSTAGTARPLAPLLLAIFTRALPLTMFGPLLPGIARSLGASLPEVGWIVATYATGSLIAQPVMGRLGDLRGARRMLLWCIGLFAGGSLACAFSTTLWALVAGRIVQSLGAGGIQPIVTAIIACRWPDAQRGRALGAVYGMYGLGTMAGALLGGAIVAGAVWFAANVPVAGGLRAELTAFPWHLVFWVNVLLGALTFAAATGIREDDGARTAGAIGFDYPGIALVCGVTAFAMLAATAGGAAMTGAYAALAAAGCLAALIAWERRAPAPLFDPALFASRGPRIIYGIALLFGIPSFSLTIYSATYYIAQFHASEAESGLALFGLATAYVIGAVAGGHATSRFGARLPLLAGLAVSGAALWLLAVQPGQPAVIAAMALGGLGLGIASAPPNALLLSYVAPSQAGAASGLATMLATSGSISAPAVISAFLRYGSGVAAADMRAEFALGAACCALCAGLAAALVE